MVCQGDYNQKTIKSAGENVETHGALLAGMGSSAATLNKLNAELPCDPVSPLIPKEMENMSTQNLVHECS